jgi:hypothetical protein
MDAFYLLPMKALHLIQQAAQLIDNEPLASGGIRDVFPSGAEWMYIWMQRLQHKEYRTAPSPAQSNLYGWGKYSMCLIAWGLAVILLGCIHPLLLPLSICIFFIVEIQGLFLFPLLIDKHPEPILESIRMTARLGWIYAFITVFCIACFMVSGLFQLKNPLRRWHIGCLAVIIWYVEQTSDRL